MFTDSQRVAGMPADLLRARNEIVQALIARRIDAAEAALVIALARAPGHPELLRLSALIDLGRGQSERAIASLLQARAVRPEDPLIHDALGTGYETIHDFARARAALHSACRLDPGNAGFWLNYAHRLYEGGDNPGALEAVQHSLRLAPGNNHARGLLATLTMAAGRHEEARDMYRRIIDDDPAGAGIVWWWFAMLKPVPFTDADLLTMQRIVDDPAVPEQNRGPTGFALAIGLEHRGRIEAAFAAMQAAHALVRKYEGPYDIAQTTQHVDAILAAFEPRPVGAARAQGKEAIFVVSLPRSGSTLTEQILASHSQVEGGGELPDFLQVVLDESDRAQQAFPAWVSSRTAEQWRMMGQRYLARTRRFRTQRARFTDKRLDNWMMAGAILSALPDARVIAVRREPLENCLACYRYMVTHGYTHTFADLAATWRNFDRAVRHWQKLFPDRFHVQNYEELVADPETQIRQLLAFCDLPFEDACLNFHATQRMVTTPSAAQVREPMRRDTARAHTYGALLDPLRAALGLSPLTPENPHGS